MEANTNAFLATLQEVRHGDAMLDLHAAMLQLVGSVRSLEKKGTLTLTITVSPAKGAAIVINDDLKLVEPKPDKEFTLFFADEENRLSRNDPRQPKLDGLTKPAADLRPFTRPIAVNDRTGEITE